MIMIRTNGDLARHHHHHRPRHRRWSDCWEGGKSIFFSSFSSFPAAVGPSKKCWSTRMIVISFQRAPGLHTHTHTYSWGKKQSSKKRTYISIKDRLYARASDESWCSDVTTHVEGRELCERQRARGRERERDGNCTNDGWYWYQEKAILCKSLGEKEKEREEEIRKCLLVVVVFVLITTLKIGRTRSRRFCLIFDTENVSSWSVSILPTSSAVE